MLEKDNKNNVECLRFYISQFLHISIKLIYIKILLCIYYRNSGIN